MSYSSEIEKMQKVIKVGKISDKDDILTLEEKRISLIENKTKRILEMTQGKSELDARRLNAYKMRIKKRIEK